MPRHDLKLKTNRKLADQLIEKVRLSTDSSHKQSVYTCFLMYNSSQGYNEGLPNPFDKPTRPEGGRRKKISANQIGSGSRGKHSASADDVTGPILGTSLDESIVSKHAQSSSTTISSTGSSSRNLTEGSGGSSQRKSGSSNHSNARHSTEGSAPHSKKSTPKSLLKRGQRSASASDITGASDAASSRDSNSSKGSALAKGSIDDHDAEAAAMALLKAKAAAAESRVTKTNGGSAVKRTVVVGGPTKEPSSASHKEVVESEKPAMGATIAHAMETSGNSKWNSALGPTDASLFKVRAQKSLASLERILAPFRIFVDAFVIGPLMPFLPGCFRVQL